jgi:hypothetical protein
MTNEKLSKDVLENKVAGDVLLSFLSIAPKVSLVSLTAFVTAVMEFNFFFNQYVALDIVGAAILSISLIVGLITLFRSVHLSVEAKLFEVLYKNPKDTKVFDDAVQFLWKKHNKTLTLQERWDGTYSNFHTTVTTCVVQWILTVIGFALLVAGLQ